MKKLIVFTDEDCPIRYACHAIQGKWKLPVIYVLCENGTLRYNELKKALGVTNVMLSNTLKEMEEEGLVIRRQYNEIPPRVDYSLTEISMMLLPVIKEFSVWGEFLMEHERADSNSKSNNHQDDASTSANEETVITKESIS
ncbi:winged helix-turn-helix transcriptional regulator [Ileibacterium valens]|uniref:winged helix-turn-helix transcriptional regulator n=1 Tax=Ileibacterium valens TaxID=1862668 RepID=UPI00259BBEC1|nr:helix-turn-helix domain-containing protein [Ileibacterium valens]